MKKTIDKKYTWDLTKIFKTDEEFYNSIKIIKELLSKIINLKGKILSSDKTLLEYYNLSNELHILNEKVYLYANLEFDRNMDNKSSIEKRELVLKLNDEVEESLSFVVPELLKSDYSYVLKLINSNDELKQYLFDMENTFRYKPHTLSEEEEKLLSNTSILLRTPRETYSALNNIDVVFDKILDEDNKEVEVTNSNYSTFLKSNNERVRKDAFSSMYKFYGSHINTISSLYISNVKGSVFRKNTRKYNSSLEMSLFGDSIDKKLYENLIKVTNNNLDLLKKYYKIKSNILGIKDMHMYDLYLNIAAPSNKKITYDKCLEIILEIVKPIGEIYSKDIKHLLTNRCVDVYPKKAKRSGAYQWGPYSVEPFVLLNYENDTNSVKTLAHEMGHAMHSYYSDKNNSVCYAGYPIFLAEIASIVNELLFSEYMFNNSKDIDDKIYYIVDYLDNFKATVYRQTMFAEFEYTIHKKYDEGENLTKDLLCDTYLLLNKKQFSPVIKVDDDIKYEWSRIPHFYTPFYVYKYSTGLICASIIASKLIQNEEGFKDKYIEFLSSGGKDYPLNILNKLGIDITNEKVLEDAFKLFKNKLNELTKLLKEKEK